MLTKDLLRFRTLSGYVRPMFVKAEEPRIAALAADLLESFRAGIDLPRAETEENLKPLIGNWTDLKLPRGLVKVLEDACHFSGEEGNTCPETRRKLFEKSAELLRSGRPVAFDSFRTEVFRAAGLEPSETPVYADLPDYERIVGVPDWRPEELIARYNCSLAQSLLIYASSLEFAVEEPDSAKLRRFFKQLRFFRLLVSAEKAEWKGGNPAKMKIRIDGPASILENGAKYGLRLASFFPAVLALSKWKMSCSVKPGLHELKFPLDETCGLSRRLGTLSAYVPEEIRMFESLFRKTSAVWRIADETPFLRAEGQEFLFPDMTFSDGSRSVSLELFHQWHAGPFAKRLEFLESHPDFPLIVGADRALFPRREGGDARIRENPLYGKKLFLFSGFPGVERVLKLLENNSGLI